MLAVVLPRGPRCLNLLPHQPPPLHRFPLVGRPQLETSAVEEQGLECALVASLAHLTGLAAGCRGHDALAVRQRVGSAQLAIGTAVQSIEPQLAGSQLNVAGCPAAPWALALLHLALLHNTAAAAAALVSWKQKRRNEINDLYLHVWN